MPITTLPKARKKKPGSLVGGNSNGSAGNFTESAMDEFLGKHGLYRKPIAKDGSCLFRAVSEQIYNCQERHLDVRNQCIDFLRRNRNLFEEFVEGPFDHHLFKLKNPKEWAGQVEITALSQMYRKDFVVYQDINVSPTKVTDHGYEDKIMLCYSNGNHYDIIYSHQFQEHAAMCQSLLFEMLYNKVFVELDKKEAGKRGKPKVTGNQGNQKNIMDLVNGSTAGEDGDSMDNDGDDDGWTEVKSKARVKHERHSKPVEVEEEKEPEETKAKPNNDQKYLWELRRSVDPHLYRNISLEIWEEGKHALQQKDMAVAASLLQFKSGDQCNVKLGPPTVPTEKMFSAIIKEDYTGSGSILVYVHELKEKHTVPVQSVSIQQNQGYKELSGHYQKDMSANGPSGEEGKDDGKFKKKRLPRNNRRGPGVKGDEPGVANEEVVLPRGRGKPRERYNRRRFPGGRDDRFNKDVKEEEEARFIAEQIKLVELQEKDPTAFPALPIRQGSQATSPSTQIPSPAAKPDKFETPISPPKEEIKVPEIEKETSPVSEDTPAGFWSKLNKKPLQKPATEEIKSPPVAKPLEAQPTSPIKTEEKNKEIGNKETKPKPISKKENDIVNAPEKENISEDKSTGSLEQETVTYFQEPLQIKPVADDSHHSKSGHVFEVKIPEQAAEFFKPTIITPATLVHTAKEPVNEAAQVDQETEEPEPDVVEDIDTSEEKMEDDEVIELDDSDLEDKKPFFSKKINLQQESSHLIDESYKREQHMYSTEETAIKSPKARASDSNVVPEKKTVTFAEETKEIPDVPYGQTQKGILIVNGTNRQEQGFKHSNTDDYSAIKETQKQDYMNIHDNQDKDHQMFPAVLANEGIQSSSPTTQQQQPAHLLYYLPHNVQLPARQSMDPSGADLPQDIPTLRHFFNLGYQYYLMMTSQLANQQLPFVYMYPGAMQEQMIQQSHQPVVSVPQQQMYGGMQHQHVAYQHGMQTYPAPFHMAPQASQDSTSQLERPNERTNQHQTPIQPQPQIQMPHQQQSGHFQSQQNQMNWRGAPNPGMTGNNRHYNKLHNTGTPSHRQQWSQGPGGNQRLQHPNNKPNRKPQGSKMRNDHGGYSPHYSSSSHSPSMSHVTTSYHSLAGEHPSKLHSQADFYPAMPYGYHGMQPGMSNLPHSTGPRGNFN